MVRQIIAKASDIVHLRALIGAIRTQIGVAAGGPQDRMATGARRCSWTGVSATSYRKPDSESNLRGSESKAVSFISNKVQNVAFCCPSKKEKKKEKELWNMRSNLGIAETSQTPCPIKQEKGKTRLEQIIAK